MVWSFVYLVARNLFAFVWLLARSRRLKELEIPVGSRIVSVIDAFDAMVSSRPYRQGLSFDEATRRLILSSGTQFDPVIVQCFLRIAQAGMPSVFEAAGTTISAAL